MKNGESVGDYIARGYYEELANPKITAARRAEILDKPVPRTLDRQVWPPHP